MACLSLAQLMRCHRLAGSGPGNCTPSGRLTTPLFWTPPPLTPLERSSLVSGLLLLHGRRCPRSPSLKRDLSHFPYGSSSRCPRNSVNRTRAWVLPMGACC